MLLFFFLFMSDKLKGTLFKVKDFLLYTCHFRERIDPYFATLVSWF